MGNTVRIIIAGCILLILLFLAAAIFYPASLERVPHHPPRAGQSG